MDSPHNAGIEALRAGDVQRAVELLTEATRAEPENVRAHMALGAALGGAGRWEEAVRALQEAVARAPEMAAAHHNLGHALEQVGRIQQAREAYRRAVALEPAHERSAAALRRLVDTPLVQEPGWPVVRQPASPAAPPASSAPPSPPPAGRAAGGTYSPLGPGGSGIPPEVAAPPVVQARVEHVTSAVRPRDPLPGERGPGDRIVPSLLGAPDPAETPGQVSASIPLGHDAAVRPPPPHVQSRLPSLSAVLIWLVVLGIFAAIGYGIVNFVLSGGPEQLARSGAERKIRDGYEIMKRGLERPDARLLVDYIPSHQKRPLNAVDVNNKTEDLKKAPIQCQVAVEKIELDRPRKDEATVTLTVRLGGQSGKRTNRGMQIWEFKNRRWAPKPDAANWAVWYPAPMSFEPWFGG